MLMAQDELFNDLEKGQAPPRTVILMSKRRGIAYGGSYSSGYAPKEEWLLATFEVEEFFANVLEPMRSSLADEDGIVEAVLEACSQYVPLSSTGGERGSSWGGGEGRPLQHQIFDRMLGGFFRTGSAFQQGDADGDADGEYGGGNKYHGSAKTDDGVLFADMVDNQPDNWRSPVNEVGAFVHKGLCMISDDSCPEEEISWGGGSYRPRSCIHEISFSWMQFLFHAGC